MLTEPNPPRTPKVRRPLVVLATVLVLVTGGVWFGLEFGLVNWGQEFGAYGPYNRVLRAIRAMPGYAVVNSRLSRRLDWRDLGHLDRFSVLVRDAKGETASVVFLRGSPEMDERDPRVLDLIVKVKFANQLRRSEAGKTGANGRRASARR